MILSPGSRPDIHGPGVRPLISFHFLFLILEVARGDEKRFIYLWSRNREARTMAGSAALPLAKADRDGQ